MRNIKVVISGRNYPLSVSAENEADIRQLAKEIDLSIKEIEENYDVKDRQDVFVISALKYGVKALETIKQSEQSKKETLHKVENISQLLEKIEDIESSS